MLYDPGQSQFHYQNPKTQEMLRKFHTPSLLPNQCSSSLVKTIDAPLALVWSIIRQFDSPQVYKRFVKSCTILSGTGADIGSIRELKLITGLPAKSSTERLESIDDDLYMMIVSIIGGDHRLMNYKSTITLHQVEEEIIGSDNNVIKTVVVESYVVDIPSDSCKEDTCLFADTIIGCNLKSLAMISEKMASIN